MGTARKKTESAQGQMLHQWSAGRLYTCLQFLERQLQPLTEDLCVRLSGGLALEYVRRAVVLLEGVPELDFARAVPLSHHVTRVQPSVSQCNVARNVLRKPYADARIPKVPAATITTTAKGVRKNTSRFERQQVWLPRWEEGARGGCRHRTAKKKQSRCVVQYTYWG